MTQRPEISIDLRQMVTAIESAIALVGMNDTNHGKRVGYMALQMANFLGFDEDDKLFAYELGLLHDCGVSSDSVHTNLVNQFDWDDSETHCKIGYNLLKDFKPLAAMALPIRHHHTKWEKLQGMDIPESDKRMANLIFLADRVDISAAPFYGKDVLLQTQMIKEVIQSRSGSYFDPELIDGFMAICEPEAFWISMEARHINRFTWDMANAGNEQPLNMADLKQLARIFSYIVDQKSPFTAEHSIGVAALSRYLAEKAGMSALEVDKVEVAAYLHDIGKLRVPDKILHKPGPLTAFERAIISQHSYETYEILRPIRGLEEMAEWAAFHHDNCIGTGYPFHPPATQIALPARIIAISDVFQALVQDRPYRPGMSLKAVLRILSEMSQEGKLDKDVVDIVIENADHCFAVARGEA